jgi:hypothetical protein
MWMLLTPKIQCNRPAMLKPQTSMLPQLALRHGLEATLGNVAGCHATVTTKINFSQISPAFFLQFLYVVFDCSVVLEPELCPESAFAQFSPDAGWYF